MLDHCIHSIEEKISHPLLQEKAIDLFVKRDDLIHPILSGNKWRKLKYVLARAEEERKKHLVTFGGIWSNHVIASACAAAKFGYKSTAFIRGEDLNTHVLSFSRIFGMNLIFVGREVYRNKQSLFDLYFGSDPDAFFVDEGGAGFEAAKGCSELIDELTMNYQHIFCACGTGTTAAGIINGIYKNNLTAKFHGVSALKGDFLREEIGKLIIPGSTFELHTDYHFGGYAKTKPALTTFVSDFAARTAILLDPIYTGKMMYALFDMIKNDRFAPGSRILAIHTGGLFGLIGMKDKFIHT